MSSIKKIKNINNLKRKIVCLTAYSKPLAKIFKKRENDELQEQNLNTVILINPKNEEALYLLTLLNIKKSDYEESDRLIKKFNKVC